MVAAADVAFSAVDGEGAAQYIKNTNGKNSNTPIVAVSAYSGSDPLHSLVFATYLAKPVQKADILAVFRSLGFKTAAQTAAPGKGGAASKLTAGR